MYFVLADKCCDRHLSVYSERPPGENIFANQKAKQLLGRGSTLVAETENKGFQRLQAKWYLDEYWSLFLIL